MKKYLQISIGELLDKISILKIKSAKITDSIKLGYVNAELDILQKESQTLNDSESWIEKLESVNSELWDVEDSLRVKEYEKSFDSEFIELARSVYYLNDKRFEIKNSINVYYDSDIQEQKSYKKYN